MLLSNDDWLTDNKKLFKRGETMSKAHVPFKWVGLLVMLLMVAAICYAGFISIKYWAGIGV